MSRSSLMRPLLPRAAPRSRRSRSPASREQRVGVGDGRVAHRRRPAGRGPCRRAPSPTCRNVAVPSARGASTNTSRAAEVLVVDELGHGRDRRDAGVGRAELGDPLVTRCVVANAAREVGADLVLHGVVGLVVEPLLAAERPAEVGEEVRLDRADREPLAVGAAVDVVAGVAAGEDVVAGAGHLAGGEVLVDVERHQRDARRRRPTRRGTRPRRCVARRTSAARIAITACMPPPAMSATVAPGQRGAAVGVAARSSRGSRRPRGS